MGGKACGIRKEVTVPVFLGPPLCAVTLKTGRNCSSKGEQYRSCHWRRKRNGVSETRGEACGAVSDHRGGTG
jgi:hypothetical protein